MPVAPFARLPATLADIRNDEERVVIYCLNCSRSRDMLVYVLRRMVGPISLGTINGRFACRGKGGCGQSIGVVLPKAAPTPGAWALHFRPRASDAGLRNDAPPDEFPFHIEEWTEQPSTRERTLAQVTTFEMAQAAFELAPRGRDRLRKLYILIRHQGRVLRDSRRDFKVVEKEAD